MTYKKKLDLQLFADGEGDGASNSGDNSVDAEQQALLDLGVPASKIRKKAKIQTPTTTVEPTEQTQVAPDTTPAEEATEDTTETTPKRLTWDEIKADPEYNKEIQATVQARLRKSKAAEEALAKVTPALELLARKYGLDASKIDYEALNKAVSDDDDYYEDKALALGVTPETAKKLDQQERDAARQKAAEERSLEEQRIADHLSKLEAQGEELKKTFPTFDLRVELQNPTFARLTAPSIGLSVEDAYHAVHRKEIQAAASQVIAQKTAEKLTASIMAGQRRPAENGISTQAPSATNFDWRTASKEQRKAVKDQIRAAAARGEKVYPQG